MMISLELIPRSRITEPNNINILRCLLYLAKCLSVPSASHRSIPFFTPLPSLAIFSHFAKEDKREVFQAQIVKHVHFNLLISPKIPHRIFSFLSLLLLESALPGEISITSDMQMTPPLWQKEKN